jgi:hypothetical protein
MREIRWFVVFACFAAAGSSAQGEKPIRPVAEVPAACALLSRQTVEQTAGFPVAEGLPAVNSGSVTSCLFPGEHGGRVMILVRRAPAADWVAEQVARMNRGVRLQSYRAVSEIGGRSFLYPVRGSGAVLCVFGAGYYLQLSLFRAGEDPEIGTLLTGLASRAVARMRAGTSAEKPRR